MGGSGQGNEWTSEQVNSKERQSNKGTSGQVNEWTGEQVNCGGRQSNKGTSWRVNKLIVNELIVKEDKVTGEQG